MTELETLYRAKRYIDKLARGIDPITDKEIGTDSCLNHVRLVRCLFYVSDILQRVIDNGGSVGQPQRKLQFSIQPQQLARISPRNYPIKITEFTKMLYDAAGNPQMKQLNPTVITSWLQEKGFLECTINAEGKTERIPTAVGRRIGITAQLRRNQYREYMANYYDSSAQQFLLDHIPEILKEKR